jgi:hypothetical protein
VAFVAPATFPKVALLAPTAEGETVARVTDGVVTRGTNGAAYTPYAGTQLLAVPPMTVACAAANPDSNKIMDKVFSERIGSSTDLREHHNPKHGSGRGFY